MNKNKAIDFVNFIVPIIFLISWMVLPVILNTPEYLIPSLGKVFQSFLDFITGYKELNTYAGMFFKHSTASYIE